MTMLEGTAWSRSRPPAIAAEEPGVPSSRRLRPWRHRGWSQLDSRLGHRLIGKVGGRVGGGGRWGDECSLVSWAGGRTALGQRLEA